MNTSKLTIIIAQGIYLYAHVQDLPGNLVKDSSEEKAWLAWCAMNPKYVQYVKDEQSQLFDRLLSK